jgi:2-polyprenyl-3-methyl-5-hydroxy-6-metoxy-1,4-benzoquinol methylase
MNQSGLPFTGERFTPECVREIWYEHWHRYAFAQRFASGKRVLDAACGEGYGTAMLSGVAAHAVGIDIDATSVAHARARYAQRANLEYRQADVTRLPFADRSFDVVVSFETLEHLAAQEQLLREFSRVLADDGVLVLSSPDKRTYSDLAGFRNEFHVRELYRDELLALLAPHFPAIRLFGQKLLFQSAIWALDRDVSTCESFTTGQDATTPTPALDYDPLYFIAVCSRAAAGRSARAVAVRRPRRIGLRALQSRNPQEHGRRRAHRRAGSRSRTPARARFITSGRGNGRRALNAARQPSQ